MIVIVANVKLAYSTNVHNFFTILMLMVSIGSFFLFYKFEDGLMKIPTLFGTWSFAMTIPSYYMLCIYFTMFVMSSETLFYYTNKLYLKRKERRLKQ